MGTTKRAVSREGKRFIDEFQRGWDNLHIGTEAAGKIRKERHPERIMEMVELQRDPHNPAKLHNARRAAIENPNTPTMYILDIYNNSEKHLHMPDPLNMPLGPGGQQPIVWKKYMPGNVAAEALAELIRRDWGLTSWERKGIKPEVLDIARKKLENEKRLSQLRNDPSITTYNRALERTLRSE